MNKTLNSTLIKDRIRKKIKLSSLSITFLLAAGALHAESAKTIRATDLQEQAQSDSSVLSALPTNTNLDVLQRKGAWSQVKTSSGQVGWVRMLSLHFDATSSDKASSGGSSANPLGALTGLLTTGRTSNTGTVTTGVKGLGEEDLKNAHENPAEFQKMQKLAVDKDEAKAFAKRSQLMPNKVAYLTDDINKTANNNDTNKGGK